MTMYCTRIDGITVRADSISCMISGMAIVAQVDPGGVQMIEEHGQKLYDDIRNCEVDDFDIEGAINQQAF